MRPFKQVKQSWDELREAGPPLGYYPNSKKCWLVVKPEKEGRAKEMFAGTGINITTEGRKHLGAALGSRSYLEQYVGGKVEDWVGEVTRLAEFARSQPQASYAAFTFGLRHRWTYFMRTLPRGARTLYYLIEKNGCICAVLANKIIRYIFLSSCVFMSPFGRDLNPIRDG